MIYEGKWGCAEVINGELHIPQIRGRMSEILAYLVSETGVTDIVIVNVQDIAEMKTHLHHIVDEYKNAKGQYCIKIKYKKRISNPLF